MDKRQQSTITYPISIFMASSTDHVTGVTGSNPAVWISKNGGAWVHSSGTVSEIGYGWYSLAGNTFDRNTLGELSIHASGTSADAFDGKLDIVPWNPFDVNAMGLAYLDTYISSRLVSGTVISSSVTGNVGGNVNGNVLGTVNSVVDGYVNVSGTVSANVSITGTVDANLVSILGTPLTETNPGDVADAVINFFDVTSPTGNINSLPDAVAGEAGGVLIAGKNSTTTFIGDTGSGDQGLIIMGDGSSEAILITGGASGGGIKIIGNKSSGEAINITANAGNGITITTTDGDGIEINGAGAGHVDIDADILGNLLGTVQAVEGGYVSVSGTVVANVGYVQVTGTVDANIVSSNNIDFTALQKTSLNAATPASVVGSVGSVIAPVTIIGYVNVTGTVDANVILWRGTQPNILQSNRVDSYVGYNADKTGYTIIGVVIVSGTVDANVEKWNTIDVVSNAIPAFVAGAVGGLPTVDANNYIAGIQGTKNQLDDLNDLAAGAQMDLVNAPNALAVTAITNDIFTEVVEGTTNFKRWLRRIGAVLFGKASGGGVVGSKKFRDTTDAVNRVDATTDANGNRTGVSFDDTDT
jgi:hypothetical protein